MSSPKGTITFGQWVKHVQYEMKNVQNLSKNACAHRTKISYLCNQLANFSKTISSFSMDPRVMPDDDTAEFQNLIQILSRFSDLIQKQSEKYWMDFFLEHDINYITDELNKIIASFNKSVIKLKLTDTPPLSWTEFQEKSNNVHDFGILRQLLENSDLPDKETKLREVNDLRVQLADEIGIDNPKSKILGLQEIQKGLASIEQWDIDPADIKFQKKIASGGFGDVFLGVRVSDDTVVAVKRLHNQQFDKEGLEMFKGEVAILAHLRHFAILPFVGACTKPPFCIITKFMSGDSLFARLHAKDANSRLTPTQLSIIALGVAYGMQYLHSQNMVHRDLKSLNILLDEDNLPKIADFGMARTKTSNNEMVSGGIGTSQWMAPEVLMSQNFDEKSDVYSYGIILWEMLTGDVPYRGLRDIQVAMTVINQNNRPKIPKSCPQNLAKFIRLCWHSDPHKRPDFTTIVQTLETGTICFPNTDIDELKAYVAQHQSESNNEGNSQNSIDIDPFDMTDEKIELLINEFKEENKILPLLNAAKHPDNLMRITQFDFIPILEEKLKNCPDNIRHLVIELTALIMVDESTRAAFLERSGSKILLDTLAKHSVSSLNKIVDCLSLVVDSEHIIFSVQHLTNLTPLLLNVDNAVRLTTIKLIKKIIVKHCFDDDSIFSVIIENLLRNTEPSSTTNILIEALDVLIQIIEFEAAKAQLRCVEGPDRIIALLSLQNQDVLLESLRLLQSLFDGTIPKQRTISEFLDKFMMLLETKNPNIQLDALNAIATLMDNTLVYKEVSAIKSFSDCFVSCINSEDLTVQVSALRICFAFCVNIITENVFEPLLPHLIKLMMRETFPAILSSYSTAAIIASHDPQKLLDEEQKEEIHSFVDNALTLESDLTEPAIRIVGVLASTMSGSQILEKWGTMEKVAELMDNANDIFPHLAVMAMASMSATCPDSNVMHEAIPKLIGVVKDPNYEGYPLICLSNITVVPRNARECAKYIKTILECCLMYQDDRFATQRSLVTVYRIVMTPDVGDYLLQDPETIEIFMECVKTLWDTEHAPILFSIIENLTQIPNICSSLKDSTLVQLIQQNLDKCSINDQNRPKFIRIRATLMASA
ncbi:TKL family protein kinase [Trichomonas vaginalis G3]|uniref:TKL family protein kinase n=1 Tax=Trichomonas vaginalis (strain ATCC PRA-98 / G3) TaxID=412133 RepID=A2FI59_TRIV3|nr:protein kinase protein [Trichomonas vaginalis G3]EAX95412.1 TKL family protein kinase [Trichomonas vaginalis G3]KAI5524121.1 protein kinase protein [Trichomonas vaginalis G3]|eukprot:XP_001308342.1 TKL family protein kinase [Trichomonas vaginalis G3]